MVFSGSGSPSPRVLLIGDFAGIFDLASVLSSLNCEHIALGDSTKVPDLGVPRNILAPAHPRRQAVDSLRRWFFRRRSGTGFLLTGFPATLSEAGILDAWVDESGETLDVCLFPPAVSGVLAQIRHHYSLQGLAWDVEPSAPLPEWIQPAFCR